VFYAQNVVTLLAGAARQPLFSVILSWAIYQSRYVCQQIFTAGQMSDASHSISKSILWPDCGCA